MPLNDYILPLSVLVGSSGLLGGIYALLKLRPEAGQITVTAAQGAVIVQTGVIENLQKELTRLGTQMMAVQKEAEAHEAELDKSRKKIRDLEVSVDFLQREMDRQGRLLDIYRRRSHIAINAFNATLMFVRQYIEEMGHAEAPPMLNRIEENFHAEMKELEKLEKDATYEAIKLEPLGDEKT